MAIEVRCSNCGKRLSARDELLGKRAKCPTCGQPILVRRAARRPPEDWESEAWENEEKPSRWLWYVAGVVVIGLAVAAVFVFDFPAKFRKDAEPEVAGTPRADHKPTPTPEPDKLPHKPTPMPAVLAEPDKLPPLDEAEAQFKLNRLNATIRPLNFVPNSIVALDHQKVTDDDLAYLRGLPKLERLSLFHTGISDKGLPHLRRLPNLNELIVSGTKITDKGMPHIGALSKLRLLALSDTKIGDDGVKHIGSLSLFALELARTSVGDAGLDHLQNMTGLLRLQLDGTRITDAGLARLPKMMQGKIIHDLYLADTAISDAGVAQLMTMKDLTHVHIERTKISPAGVRKLQQALPRLKISGP